MIKKRMLIFNLDLLDQNYGDERNFKINHKYPINLKEQKNYVNP